MAYKRKTKDVECRKCGNKSRVPADHRITGYCCITRRPGGHRCLGNFRLAK